MTHATTHVPTVSPGSLYGDTVFGATFGRYHGTIGQVAREIRQDRDALPVSFDARELIGFGLTGLVALVAGMLFYDILPAQGPVSVERIPTLVVVNLAVPLALIVHELGHKVVANRIGYIAEFNPPRTVMIKWPDDVEFKLSHRGITYAAGPVANYALVIAVFPLIGVFNGAGNEILAISASRIVALNAIVGVSNLIPYSGVDGYAVKEWSLDVWFGLTVFGIILTAMVIITIGPVTVFSPISLAI